METYAQVAVQSRKYYFETLQYFCTDSSQVKLDLISLREKCPNTKFFLVRIFPYSA